MDKQEVIAHIKRILNENLEVAKKSYDLSKNDLTELPTRNESRYDTMGIETSWLADGLADRISELERDIYEIDKLKIPANKNIVLICSLVYLKNITDNKDEKYIILPAGGGQEIPYNGTPIQIISNNAPLSQSLFGKKKGDRVELVLPKRIIEYIVEDIY